MVSIMLAYVNTLIDLYLVIHRRVCVRMRSIHEG
jgi:hypothetical protein